jgi:hypothetical protein
MTGVAGGPKMAIAGKRKCFRTQLWTHPLENSKFMPLLFPVSKTHLSILIFENLTAWQQALELSWNSDFRTESRE